MSIYLLFLLAAFVAKAAADCACGYLDPSTGFVWTDRTITYFNETQAREDIVFDPAVSPAWSGNGVQGETGQGQEAWAVGSAAVNLWETGWTSTYRDGYAANNTQLVNTSSFTGLDLMVPPADRAQHISNGSVLISRRRDILYGSFRVSMKVPESWVGGSMLEMSARFNGSEMMTVSLLAADYDPAWSTFRWSYSASGHPNAPVIGNLSQLGADKGLGLHEHRMDWARYPGLSFSNDAHAGNNSQSEVFTGGRNKHIPSTPATFSLRHYANGEQSQSGGPPIMGVSHGQVQYARLFFNSSLVTRQEEFERQCLIYADALCSTEDNALRGSTPFNVTGSTQRYVYVAPVFRPKRWALITFSAMLGMSVVLCVHALSRRAYNHHVRYAQYDKEHKGDLSVQDGGASLNEEEKDDELAKGEIAWDTPQVLLADQPWLKRNHEDDKGEDDDSDDESELDEYEWSVEEDKTDKMQDELDTLHNAEADPYTLPSHTFHRLALTRQGTNQTQLSLLSRPEAEAGSHSRSMAIWNTPVRRWLPKRKKKEQLNVQDDSASATDPVGLAEAADSADFVQKEKPSLGQLLRSFGSRVHDMLFVSDKEMGVTSSGINKVAYLSSLRGFAALLITLGHFVSIFDHVPGSLRRVDSPSFYGHYPRIVYFLYVICFSIFIGGWASFRVAMFFVLPARILGTRYLAKGGLQNLADKSIRILIRLVFAVACVSLFEYFLFDVDAFRWIQRIPSRTWTIWSYAESYGNIGEYINSMISLWFVQSPVQPAIVQRYAIGIMWTMPLMLQLNFTLFLCAIIAREIKNHYKRYAFYSACLLVTWYSGKLDFLFILGLVVADLDVKLDYRTQLAKGIPLVPKLLEKKCKIPRIPGQIIGWIVFLAGFGMYWSEVTGVGPFLRMTEGELRLRPNFETGHPIGWDNPTLALSYSDLKLTCILPVLGFYLLCDLCKPFEKFFRLRILRTLGKHSFGIFVIHGAVYWSIGSFVMVKLLANGLPYWVAELSTFLVSYTFIMIMAVIFTHTVDAWSAQLSVAAWRLVTRGYGQRST